ncbi:hypothetical protein H756_YJM428N00183 [Saccharomyces cerevisiae YJM428]|nr:hypothetical protein H756_YJM428N00183 [Saccharomyces cerevisiae YJM428]
MLEAKMVMVVPTIEDQAMIVLHPKILSQSVVMHIKGQNYQLDLVKVKHIMIEVGHLDQQVRTGAMVLIKGITAYVKSIRKTVHNVHNYGFLKSHFKRAKTAAKPTLTKLHLTSATRLQKMRKSRIKDSRRMKQLETNFKRKIIEIHEIAVLPIEPMKTKGTTEIERAILRRFRKVPRVGITSVGTRGNY